MPVLAGPTMLRSALNVSEIRIIFFVSSQLVGLVKSTL